VNAGAGDTPGPEIAAPVRAIAGQASASNTAVTIRGSTLAASGNGFDAALYAYRPVGDAGDVNVDVRNSALRVLNNGESATADVVAEAANSGSARVTLGYSLFNIRAERNGGAVTAPGSAGNVVGDAPFVNPTAGDFTPAG